MDILSKAFQKLSKIYTFRLLLSLISKMGLKSSFFFKSITLGSNLYHSNGPQINPRFWGKDWSPLLTEKKAEDRSKAQDMQNLGPKHAGFIPQNVQDLGPRCAGFTPKIIGVRVLSTIYFDHVTMRNKK